LETCPRRSAEGISERGCHPEARGRQARVRTRSKRLSRSGRPRTRGVLDRGQCGLPISTRDRSAHAYATRARPRISKVRLCANDGGGPKGLRPSLSHSNTENNPAHSTRCAERVTAAPVLLERFADEPPHEEGAQPARAR
jgi:hypothetical protein